MRNRIKTIKKIANSIIEKYKLMPPINLETIYTNLGITLVEESNQYGIEAYSDLSDSLRVCINSELNYYAPRRRFTLAHELGHVCIIWHNGDIKCETDNNYVQIDGRRYLDTQELEANIFASELLMPTSWLEAEIQSYLGEGFFSLVEKISQDADTSIMASLFALENKLPCGHIYFVRNVVKDYWMTFKSINTFTVSWNYHEEKNIEFLDQVCNKKETKTYANHEVIYYELLPCPPLDKIGTIYKSCNQDFQLFINAITNSQPLKVLTFLDAILEQLPETYAVYIICDNQIVKRLCDYSNPLSTFYAGLGVDNILSICNYYSFDAVHMTLGCSYELISIKEKVFTIPKCKRCDPNSLLRSIVYDICSCEEAKHVLQSINGVISSINSQYRDASREELYNWTKYRFYTNSKYEVFCEHPDFETYIVNKIDKMILMRK